MKFTEVIEGLKKGHLFTRAEWRNDVMVNTYIVAQIPQTLSPGIVREMTSLPLNAKDAIVEHWAVENSGQLAFHDQVLIIRSSWDGSSATSYVPTWEDIFAEDWQIGKTAEG